MALDRFVPSGHASAEITGLCSTQEAMKKPSVCTFNDWMSAAIFSITLCTASCLAATVYCNTIDVQQGVYLSHSIVASSHKSVLNDNPVDWLENDTLFFAVNYLH